MVLAVSIVQMLQLIVSNRLWRKALRCTDGHLFWNKIARSSVVADVLFMGDELEIWEMRYSKCSSFLQKISTSVKGPVLFSNLPRSNDVTTQVITCY